ncbi:MAG: hypothetical protein ACR2QK_05505 [Acidimicrobiales bacterium]
MKSSRITSSNWAFEEQVPPLVVGGRVVVVVGRVVVVVVGRIVVVVGRVVVVVGRTVVVVVGLVVVVVGRRVVVAVDRVVVVVGRAVVVVVWRRVVVVVGRAVVVVGRAVVVVGRMVVVVVWRRVVVVVVAVVTGVVDDVDRERDVSGGSSGGRLGVERPTEDAVSLGGRGRSVVGVLSTAGVVATSGRSAAVSDGLDCTVGPVIVVVVGAAVVDVDDSPVFPLAESVEPFEAADVAVDATVVVGAAVVVVWSAMLGVDGDPATVVSTIVVGMVVVVVANVVSEPTAETCSPLSPGQNQTVPASSAATAASLGATPRSPAAVEPAEPGRRSPRRGGRWSPCPLIRTASDAVGRFRLARCIRGSPAAVRQTSTRQTRRLYTVVSVP